MQSQDEIRKELESLAPKLAALKKGERVEDLPSDDYFEDLEDRLTDQLFSVERNHKGRIRRLWTYTSVVIAASIALFFLTRPVSVDIAYPETEALTDAESYILDQFETDELEGFLTITDPSYQADDIDVESILIEEDHLEEFLNI